jgi:processing peptidase subunit alpha
LEALPNLTAQTVINFRNQYLLNPKSMVVAAAGIQHEHLVSLADKYFGNLQTPSSGTLNHDNGVIESKYIGGSHRQTVMTPDGFTRVALAFPTGGWHSNDLVPACVLQTLLGGGNSFSAGGPGKGMYSRLYRQVLNRYYWAESCEAFTSFHAEGGLLGISGSTIPHKAGDMTKVLAEHFMRLAMDHVEDEELDRARNMLKCNVLTQLESRLVLFEDVGRQILTYNKREESKDMCAKIDAVTKDDLRNLARASIAGIKPTLCTVGDDVTNVPELEDVERWFQHQITLD